MGYKRLFEDTDFQGFPLNPLKQARQQDLSNRSTQFEENLSDISSPKKPDSAAVDHCDKNGKQLCHEASENTLVPRNCTDEDIGFRFAAYTSMFPPCYDYNGLQEHASLNTVGISYLDRFPRKQVSLGRDHQASIPSLVANAAKPNDVLMSSSEKLMGTCIIPMPDKESSIAIESGISDCRCLDAGSLRCVRQHIAEARDKLKKSLGHEKFVSLGFHNMGEDVSWKWSEEEERLFRAVVYSNPVSLGQNFWKHLAQVFPCRSMKEIVSYYFNVFMLRKRGTQNRSSLLDIDSDDDELHGIDIGTYEGEEESEEEEEEEEDSAIESPVEHYGQSNRGEEVVTEDDADDDDDDNDDDGDMGNGYRNVTVQHSGDPDRSNNEEDITTVQDDSCTSFEFQSDKDDPYYLMNRDAALQASEVDKGGDAAAAVDLVSMLDFRDEKAWDAIFPGSA
ncbi:AT-rich interactive domain-containing protein 2 [Linum grandiflorum]